MNKETRLEFEKWAQSEGLLLGTQDGYYFDIQTREAHKAWQAALSTRPMSDKGIREALEGLYNANKNNRTPGQAGWDVLETALDIAKQALDKKEV